MVRVTRVDRVTGSTIDLHTRPFTPELKLRRTVLAAIQAKDLLIQKSRRRRMQWNRNQGGLEMTLWNPRSLSFETFCYAKSLGFDVLVMPELWRNAHKFTDGSLMWTHSKAQKDKHDNLKYPDDRAAGNRNPTSVRKGVQ